MRDLQQKLGITYLFIAHDLGVVRYLCDTVAVLYRGRIAEIAEKSDIYRTPRHPYTESLIAAAPLPEPEVDVAPPPQVHAAQDDVYDHSGDRRRMPILFALPLSPGNLRVPGTGIAHHRPGTHSRVPLRSAIERRLKRRHMRPPRQLALAGCARTHRPDLHR